MQPRGLEQAIPQRQAAAAVSQANKPSNSANRIGISGALSGFMVVLCKALPIFGLNQSFAWDSLPCVQD